MICFEVKNMIIKNKIIYKYISHTNYILNKKKQQNKAILARKPLWFSHCGLTIVCLFRVSDKCTDSDNLVILRNFFEHILLYAKKC